MMKCPVCGGENPSDYKFCAHCGTPRAPVTPEGINLTPQAPKAVKTGHSLFKQKWFIALLIAAVLFVCLLVVAVVVLVLVQTGKLSLGGGGGDNILIGMTSRSSQTDLYQLGLGDELEKGTLLAEDAMDSSMYFSYRMEDEDIALGNYYNSFGGFIPEQKLMVLSYEDEDGDVYVQRQALNQDAAVPVFDGNGDYGYGQVLNSGKDIFINENVGEEERCYVSFNGEAAQRITKGDECSLSQSGTVVLTWEVDGEQTTLTRMNLDGSEAVTLLDGVENVSSYQGSFDGSRVAYVAGADEQQVTLLDGRNAEVLVQSEPAYHVISYTFAERANALLYVAENDEGELVLYLLKESGAVLVASGMTLAGEFSRDGAYLLYMTGDENQEYTVSSYNVASGQSSEIIKGENLSISVATQLERALIAQQEDDELTVYSARLDGSDLVTLFSDSNTYLGALVTYPERSELFIAMYNDDSEYSLFYTPIAQNTGYYLMEEYYNIAFRDVSPDGRWLLAVATEDANDDPALIALSLEPEQTPVRLDESEDDFGTAVFSSNSRQVIYTALTGNNPDDSEIRRVELSGETTPETLYSEAYLLDVQWTRLAPFTVLYFNEPLESSSFCPGAPTITAGSSMEGQLSENSEMCYRFTGNADQLLTFTVESEFDTVLTLYDRDGYQLDRDDDSGAGMNPRLTVNITTPGTYFMVVTVYGSGTGSYTIEMQEGISDANQAVPLEANVLTRDYINSSDTIYLESMDHSTYGVLYSFEGTANQQVTIDVIANSVGSRIDSYIYLFDAAMNLLITDDDSGSGYDSQIIYSLPADGRYYILVEDLSGNYGPEAEFWFDILLTR
jgi:hypothetical protein